MGESLYNTVWRQSPKNRGREWGIHKSNMAPNPSHTWLLLYLWKLGLWVQWWPSACQKMRKTVTMAKKDNFSVGKSSYTTALLSKLAQREITFPAFVFRVVLFSLTCRPSRSLSGQGWHSTWIEYNKYGSRWHAGCLISCKDPHFPVRLCGLLGWYDRLSPSHAPMLLLFLVSFVQLSPF